ncbi:UDP-glucuronic acid dehydrogenase [Aliivibrio fischeri]|uniref:UDP-glucuronic acid dehydrogenase n=1 Tax=Aliivibrio fischeri TaxID=668 RepID=UPI0012DA84FF|nr:UDP-glucuronic acid dehydrogenase [Aliivibrio fischeri]MUL09198.1 UDP-glucuronic acid dehydrogenase [Aliivibrio fischeri]MUL13974.1 UDP-glucuronic acid dehydrogenase [Aliivibrio fischeri]
MKVTIICSDSIHPVYPYLERWIKKNIKSHDISIYSSITNIEKGGDILFLISCSEIVKKPIRDMFRYTLVLHASDLPEGRGWSPHIWDIINGKNTLVLSLLNAEDGVDTGDIWQKRLITLDGSELYEEINHKVFEAELGLMSWACENIDNSEAIPQDIQNGRSDYHRKRIPEDSQLSLDKSIEDQFNLLRVCDSNRFPAYIIRNGQRYNIKLEKVNDE